MSTPTKKEKEKIPNLFGLLKIKGAKKKRKKWDGYLYVDFNEVLPKRAKTNLYLPDLKGDWHESVQGWPVHAKIVDEGEDYIEVIGDKWEIFTEVVLKDDALLICRTTKTPVGVERDVHKVQNIADSDKESTDNPEVLHKYIMENQEAVQMALHSLGWGFPEGYIPDEFRIAKKFNSRPIEL